MRVEITDSIQVSSENLSDPLVFDKIRSFLKWVFLCWKPPPPTKHLHTIETSPRHHLVSSLVYSTFYYQVKSMTTTTKQP